MKPSKYLFIPLKDGKWLRDSQGKPRMYKSQASALANLTHKDYDSMQVYAIEDIVSRKEFERRSAKMEDKPCG